MASALLNSKKRIDTRLMPENTKLLYYCQLAILVASILVSAFLILKDSGVVPAWPMDQHFVESVNLLPRYSQGKWAFQYPSLQSSGGITSSLIAGLYKVIIPTSHENLNWHIRIFAMATYLASTMALARTFIRNQATAILAFLIIACSGFQLLQPSSDLFAGTLLSLFFVGAERRWPRPYTSLLLAGFGLCKVDMIAAAILLALFWTWWEYRQGAKNSLNHLGFTLMWLGLLLLPGFVVQSSSPLDGARSMIAFMSAYSEFFGYHQFTGTAPADSLGAAIELARINIFNGATSFGEIVTKHPRLYLDFVGVSAVRSLPNIVNVLKLMLIPIIVVYLHHKHINDNRFLLWGSLIAAVCVITPAWLVIYLRLRYAVKIAAPLIVIALSGSLELGLNQPRYRSLAWLCGIGSILWGLWFLGDMAQHSHWK